VIKIISHRGNINGPEPEKENSLKQISNALDIGFDVEIDAWVKDDEKIYLGHDEPSHPVDLKFILKHNEKLWVHCKNIEAMSYFNDFNFINFFGHSYDNFTLTSKRYIFTKPGQRQTRGSVCVMPEKSGRLGDVASLTYGVCTDFPMLYKENLLGETPCS
jgi:glycerophosphoryl diester phosphodiesterase